MAELTKDHIEAAAKACYEAQFLSNDYLDKKTGCMWDLLADHCKAGYRRSAVAAAPFLQLPWDDPTQEELNACIHATLAKGNKVATGLVILQEFVAMRNKANSPVREDKPKDARVSMLVDLFHKNHPTMMSPADFAKEILELLDRKA